jgi:hypothetical protein
MKYGKYINVLVIIIAVLSTVACLAGFFWGGGEGTHTFTSIHGETVQIHGTGLYANDSVSVVAQGAAQDWVTLLMGIPLLIISLVFANKGSFRGRLVLTGTLAYFWYSFMTYTFLWNYNQMFLVYVALVAASMYAFILALLSFDVGAVPGHFRTNFPRKFMGVLQICIGLVLCLLWLGRIVPGLAAGTPPVGLEHYTTLVIQGMDLGFIVPAAILSGVLVLQRKAFGYLLTSVIILKAITMTTCLTAMIVSQAMSGVAMSPVELIIFPAFNAFCIIALVLLMRSIKKQGEN